MAKNKKEGITPTNSNLIPEKMPNPYGLNPQELMLAFFLAVRSMCGLSYSLPSSGSEYPKQFNVSDKTLKSAMSGLLSKGLISSTMWRDPFVLDDFRLPLIHLLVADYPAQAKVLKEMFNNWIGSTRIFGIMEWAAGKSVSESFLERQHITQELQDLICHLNFTKPWMMKLLRFLDPAYAFDLISQYVRMSELGYPEYPTERITDMLKCMDLEDRKVRTLADAIDYLAFVRQGVEPALPASGKVPSTRPYMLACAGIMLCYKGKYDLAIDFLRKAAKGLPVSTLPGTPNLLFASYFLAVALYATYNSHALASMAIRTTSETLQPMSIVASAANSDITRPATVLMENLEKCQAPASKAFFALFSKYYLNVSAPAMKLPLPDFEILRSELRNAIALSPEQKQKTELRYGPAPALASIKILPNWEKKVNEIMTDLDSAITHASASDEKGAEEQVRYFYVCEYYSNVVKVRKKTMLKSGNWSVLKNVSIASFVDAADKLTDKYDSAMCALATKCYLDKNNSHYYFSSDPWPTLSEALPVLVGCDRVLMEKRDGSLAPLAINEEKAIVKIREAADKLMVESNITLSDLANNPEEIIRKNEKTNTFTVLRLNQQFNGVLAKLLQTGTFPADARDAITVLLAKMSDYVEVQSPLLDSASIPDYDGDTAVIVQMQPMAAGLYSADMFVRPYPESRHKHTPGKGKEQYIALHQGKSTRIHRDLVAEAANFDAIAEALADTEADIDFQDTSATLDIDAVLTLLEWAKENPKKAAIEWPEKNGIRLQRLAPGSWNVGLKSNNGWFDIEGDVKLDDATVLTMAQLLQSINASKGRYIRLDDGKFIEIDKKLRNQLARLEALAVKNRNKLQISQFNAALIDQTLADGEVQVKFDEKLLDLRQRVKDAEKYDPAVPATLNATLRPYQEDGVRWMARLASWGAGACLADDMGLGKTVQTIAFMLLKAEEGPALVVAPASVVPNWANELERFAPSLNVKVVNKAEDRAATIKEAKPYDVVLITYGLLSNEQEALTSVKWCTICLDEAHTIKNRETKMSQAAMALSAQNRIILTGTPLQNNLSELWNLFRFINPGLLGSYESFREKFVRPIAEDGDRERRHALQRIIKPFMLRRTKADVASDLPEKTEVYIPIELSAEENAMYEAMRAQAASALESKDKVDVGTLAEISRLRRAACSIRLVDDKWTGPNSKVQAFLDLVQDCQGADNNMLVFSQYTSFLEIVRKALDEAKIPYLYLDGSTPMARREKLVEEFNTGKTPLFLISLKAGGLGLNLPAANYVVHLDPWWNPAIEQQATDRAYRIGQKRKVMVYHMLSKGTIEEKIRRLHATKRDMADSLLEGADMAASLTMKDILDLISTR